MNVGKLSQVFVRALKTKRHNVVCDDAAAFVVLFDAGVACLHCCQCLDGIVGEDGV